MPNVTINQNAAVNAAKALWKISMAVGGAELIIHYGGKVLHRAGISEDTANYLKQFDAVDFLFDCGSAYNLKKGL